MKIMIINGPNMNMLGIREPDIYGPSNYEDLVSFIREKFPDDDLEFLQSNHEGDLVDGIQRAYFEKFDGIVINAAAYTHTSVAIADALRAVKIPAVEVHISDTDSRESYRRVSYLRSACIGTIQGKGFEGYAEAVGMLKDAAAQGE